MIKPSWLIFFPGLLGAAACGGSESPPSGQGAPVYYGQVQRILQDNCVECHSADPDRLAPFSLATYDDAVDAATHQGIAFAVMNRVMPPYYATNDGSCQSLTTKWLSDADIETLVSWTNGAHPAGDVANSIAPPPPPPALPAVDATLDIGGDYTPDAALADDYRCFVVNALGTTATERFVTGAHVRPSNFSVAHHVIVFSLDSATAEADAAARDAADPGLGYHCSAGGPTDGATFLVGWAPGNQAQLFPPGTGIPVVGNRKLVVQVHYNLATADGKPDHTRVDLDLADAVTYRGQMVAVRGDVNLPPRSTDALAAGSRKIPTGLGALRIWGAMVHMHQRGIAAQVSVAGSTNTCLADLKQWSFHWQHYYPYKAPVSVNGGDTLRLSCHYDTSNDSATVTWGEGTADEMCISYLYMSQ
jgi:mono/diheme cytochrome c family protein